MLRTAIIGLGGISRQHIPAITANPGYKLVAACDIAQAACEKFAADTGLPTYGDAATMLAAEKPEVVVVATAHSSHAALTCLAARAGGVRAIVCEKPMAVHPADAREMVKVCDDAGILLVVNHQRRMGDIGKVAQMIDSGIIGDIVEMCAYCAGDLLSDGTHAIDALLALAGDPPVERVLQAVIDTSEVKMRYGSPAEKGLWVHLISKNFMTIHCGSFADRRNYLEFHIQGSCGSLWRTGDFPAPNWFLNDGKPGTHEASLGSNGWFLTPQPAANGLWRPLDTAKNAPAASYAQILDSLANGTAHPLEGKRTLAVQDIITAAYVSALEHRPVDISEAATIEKFPLTI